MKVNMMNEYDDIQKFAVCCRYHARQLEPSLPNGEARCRSRGLDHGEADGPGILHKAQCTKVHDTYPNKRYKNKTMESMKDPKMSTAVEEGCSKDVTVRHCKVWGSSGIPFLHLLSLEHRYSEVYFTTMNGIRFAKSNSRSFSKSVLQLSA